MRRIKIAQTLHAFLCLIVFTFLDILDSVFCYVYAFLDELLEGKASPCYCNKTGNNERGGAISETLYGRRNVFGAMRLLWPKKPLSETKEGNRRTCSRWSDCGCDNCVSWMKDGQDLRLHVAVQEPDMSAGDVKNLVGKAQENVIFLHGFMSSSSFWTEIVFKNSSEHSRSHYRLFAVDLLGFGRSPKPRDCLYTSEDHVEMIEKSVINPFQLTSFHLVAHSMGSIIALALAAKHPQTVKSVTLIAPPYFPSSKEDASTVALNKLADKRLWPPLLFGAAFMSWYEHLGRTVCFIICRNHKIWEFLMRVVTRHRDLHFLITDFTKHTHHSAWHNMHNVICGGAKLLDEYLEILSQNGVKRTVIQGDEDKVVPLECSYNIKVKAPETDLIIVPKCDHLTVVLNQTKEFTQSLETIWMSCN